MRNICQRAAQ